VGLPIWFVVGILITFSPEFGKALGLSEPVQAGKAVMLAFAGQVAGDIASGFLSQWARSRKKIILLFILLSTVFIGVYLLAPVHDLAVFYAVCVCLGFANGYWTLFVTIGAELFGTNLRATVATHRAQLRAGCRHSAHSLVLMGKKPPGRHLRGPGRGGNYGGGGPGGPLVPGGNVPEGFGLRGEG
jgi:MFS family permease